jgi:hypothetical protein
MRSVTCSEVDQNLWRYIDREIPASDLSAISAHLRACDPCRARYHEWAREASQYRRVLDETPFGEAFVGRLRHRMRDEGLFASSRRSPLEALSFHRRRVRRIATVAAMLFLIPVVVVVGILSNLPDPILLGNFTAEGGFLTFLRAVASTEDVTRHRVARGDFAPGDGFEVPHGVVVTLKLGSPSRREDSILILTGPASFRVAREARKVDFSAHLASGIIRADIARRAYVEPFQLTTADAVAKVLGTEFELSALDGQTVLTVRKGTVAFQAINALPGKAIQVTPENGAHVVRKGALEPVPAGDGAVNAPVTPTTPPPVTPAVPETDPGEPEAAAGEDPSSAPAPPAPAPERKPPARTPTLPGTPPAIPGSEDLDTPVVR